MVCVLDTAKDSIDLHQASWVLYDMIQAFVQAPSYYLVFEAILVICIVRLLFIFTKSYKPKRTVLTEEDKEKLVEEWQPEPLVPDIDENHPILQNMANRLVEGKFGKYVTVSGKKCINVASMNFLGLSGRSEIEEAAVKCLRKYGVGACGPRGFYGTVDVHLQLETKLKEFMRCDEAIIYCYGFATIASAIPAYSKRGDVIFVDEGVNFAIQKGIQASRSQIVFFKHNDPDDLERLLKIQAEEDKKNPKKAKVTRRFLVVEGLYVNYGDICPLPRLVELKHQYKVRLFIDETISFGTLGNTGRGVTEHYNVPIDEIDLITASMENSLASVGGFSCGKTYIINHQRVCAVGYFFSASAPPMLSQAAIMALELLENTPELLVKLKNISKYMYTKLSMLKFFSLSKELVSPIVHLYLATPSGQRDKDLATLRKIVSLAEDKNIALTVSAYLDDEIHLPEPSIRVAINCELTHDDIDRVVGVLSEVSASI